MSKLKLYSCWFSSCSHRVRIALNLKGLEYEYKAVDILKGEQFDPGRERNFHPCGTPHHLLLEYEKLNPVKFVPTLVDGDFVLADSFAILLYLEDKYPQIPLLPIDPKMKAVNIQVASIVFSSIQPLHAVTSPRFIEGLDTEERHKCLQKVINGRFEAIEKLLKEYAGKYATGDEIQLADVFLEPQIHAGVTLFEIDMSLFPTLTRLHEEYNKLPAFQAALPLQQPDAPSSS